MKEELTLRAEGALIQILDDITNVREFAIEQTPLVIQELLTWNFWYFLIRFVIGVLIPIFALFLFKYIRKKILKIAKDNDYEWEPADYIPIGFANFPVVLAFLTLTVSHLNLEWLKIVIAPRLWLIEYTASLAK